ncbi:unnamed protein product, partial [Ectocarpus sp. 13 AM-2016]
RRTGWPLGTQDPDPAKVSSSCGHSCSGRKSRLCHPSRHTRPRQGRRLFGTHPEASPAGGRTRPYQPSFRSSSRSPCSRPFPPRPLVPRSDPPDTLLVIRQRILGDPGRWYRRIQRQAYARASCGDGRASRLHRSRCSFRW